MHEDTCVYVCGGGEEYQNLMISEAPASAAAVYACILVRSTSRDYASDTLVIAS